VKQRTVLIDFWIDSRCFGITHFIALIFYSISPKVKKKAVLVVRSCQLEIIVTRASTHGEVGVISTRKVRKANKAS
jgi:hypothetical protein